MSRIEELPRVLLRVTSREKAKRFVNKGIIEFSRPRDWIAYCEKEGNNRIGDKSEGIFLRKSILEKNTALHQPGIISKIDNGYINYWKSATLDLPAICFYGIGSNNIINKKVKTLYHEQDIGYVDTSYFKDFVNNSKYSKEAYSKVDKSNQKVVILIYEPVRLFNMIKDNVKCGILRDNIDYVEKSRSFDPNCTWPNELFYKDNSYKSQSEFRIVLQDPSIKTVVIGSISHFCKIEEMYFERMDFAFQEDNTFVYKLPNPITENYYEKGFEELATLFLSLAYIDYPVQSKGIEEYFYLVNKALPYFQKYGITPYVDINEKTNSFNIKYTFEDELWKQEFYKIYNDLHRYNDKHFHGIMKIKDK